MNILLIEDSENIAEGISYALEKKDYHLFHASTISQGYHYLEKENFDFIILDVMLTDGNGFDFFEKEIRSKNIPTIFLTAKDDEEDIVKGLNMGAEDYMVKPFSMKELLARMNRILLREKKNAQIKIKDILFDFDKIEVYKNGDRILFSSLELKILSLLFLNKNKLVRRSMILDLIWEATGNDVDDHTVTVYMKRIREKLDCNIIRTVKGLGYLVETDEK